MRCFYFNFTHKALNVYITMSKGHILGILVEYFLPVLGGII